MTIWTYLVIMSTVTYEAVQRALAAFQHEDEEDSRARKRRRIVEAATRLFIKHGYRKTSVDDVAREAGVAKGTVYLYAKGKNDLLVQAVVEEKRRYLERVRDLFVPGIDPRERLRSYIRSVIVLAGEMPLVSRLLSGDHELLLALEELDPDVRAQSAAMQQQFLDAMLDEAAAPHRWTERDLADRSKALYAVLLSVLAINDESVRGGQPLERYADLVADMLVNGIAPRSAGGHP
jgi:AcrR family transcriptional regulator